VADEVAVGAGDQVGEAVSGLRFGEAGGDRVFEGDPDAVGKLFS
jgi:hypothetical protein